MKAHQLVPERQRTEQCSPAQGGRITRSVTKSAKECSAMATPDMVVYLVDRDLPGFTAVQLLALQQAAITACQRFSAAGRPIQYLRSMIILGEARCMCLFAAPDLALVQAVNDAAQLPFTRIVEALDLTP
jgi:Nickel responsive protein SCO4226-like